MKVYVIAHGEYSDYSHVAMFSTRALAQEAIEAMVSRYGDESIEEWDVLDVVPAKKTLHTKECNAGVVREFSSLYDGWADPEHTFVGTVKRGLGFGRYGNGNRNYRFWGLDKKRVHKAFDDYHAHQMAEAAGVA